MQKSVNTNMHVYIASTMSMSHVYLSDSLQKSPRSGVGQIISQKADYRV